MRQWLARAMAMWRPSSVTIEFMHGTGTDQVTDVQVTCNFPARYTVSDKRAALIHREEFDANDTLNIAMPRDEPAPGLTTLAADPRASVL